MEFSHVIKKTTLSILFLAIVATGQTANASNSCSRIFLTLKHPSTHGNPLKNFSDELIASAESSLRKAGWKPLEGHGVPEDWTLDGPTNSQKDYNPTEQYDYQFSEVLGKIGITKPQGHFKNLLKESRSQGIGTNVLDLFGSGFFVEDQSLADSITGMRYGPYAGIIPKSYFGKQPEEVLGDAMNSKTWKRLDHSMKARSIPAMDLVTMRPEGGWQRASFSTTPNQNAQAIKFIVGPVLKRLSPTGRFYFSVPIPDLPGSFSEYPVLQELVSLIESQTPYKLILSSETTKLLKTSTTYYLDGAIVPK